MDDDTGLLFDLPSVARKKVSAAFDGGRITSDGGVALLALADRRIGIVDRIARLQVILAVFVEPTLRRTHGHDV